MPSKRSGAIPTPKIVQPQRHRHPLVWALLVLALALWTWQVFEFGQRQALRAPPATPAELAALRERVSALQQEILALREGATRDQRMREIDQQATQAVQGRIADLERERAAHAAEVETLRAELSAAESAASDALPTGPEGEIELNDYAISSLEDGNRFHYSFTLARSEKGEEKLRGRVTLRVTGSVDGAEQDLGLAELTDGEVGAHRLGFRHFQPIEGELALPEGFAPRRVTIDMTLDDAEAPAASWTYDWP